MFNKCYLFYFCYLNFYPFFKNFTFFQVPFSSYFPTPLPAKKNQFLYIIINIAHKFSHDTSLFSIKFIYCKIVLFYSDIVS